MTSRPQGFSLGYSFRANNRQSAPGLRSKVCGWSRQSSHRNTVFLQSVDWEHYSRHGCSLLAFTLTQADCPESSYDYHEAIRTLTRRVRSAYRDLSYHWVIEWQRRRVPHLHVVMTLDTGLADYVVLSWLDITRKWRSARAAQCVRLVSRPEGWAQYLSKHAARTVAHYQRSNTGIPDSWNNRTGRLWARSKNWVTVVPQQYFMSLANGHIAIRRLRRWQSAISGIRRKGQCRSWTLWGSNLCRDLLFDIIADAEPVPICDSS